MTKELPESISIDDAVALILNISYIPNGKSVLAMLSYFTVFAEFNYDHAVNQDEKSKYRALTKLYKHREEMGNELYEALSAEIECIQKGKTSELEVSDNTFGNEKLVTASVCSWAYDIGFGIQGWQPPRFWRKKNQRTYSTEYLDILDNVIAVFCEKGGEHYEAGVVPKKEAVTTWINEEYGPLSEKVLDVIATIIRPGLTRPSRK